jgi:hypothetical protein
MPTLRSESVVLAMAGVAATTIEARDALIDAFIASSTS